MVDTDVQRGAAKHLSEIVAQTGNNHKMIGALGHAKTLSGIIMGCETVDVNGLPFTLVVPDESVSDPTLTDSLIPVGRLKEDGFDVSFQIPVEAHIDGVDLTVYPKYGGRIITPGPDSRTVFMEYAGERVLFIGTQFSILYTSMYMKSKRGCCLDHMSLRNG